MSSRVSGTGADYFDPKRRPPAVAGEHIDRLLALCEGGLDRSQAKFAAWVMHIGGVFTADQAAAWLDVESPDWDAGEGDPAAIRRNGRTRFLQSLFREYGARQRPTRLAVTRQMRGGGQFAHVGSKPAYAAVGVENSRYRRVPPLGTAMQRLLLHDYALETMDRWTWYGSTEQKVALFDALGVGRDVLPARAYGDRRDDVGTTTRYFPDHLPVAVGGWKVCFPFVFYEDRTVEAGVARLEPYRPLWAALRALGLWVQTVIVGRCGDRGDWERRLAPYVDPPSGADRGRLVDQVERYLIERFEADGLGPVLRAYGGASGATERARELERSLGVESGEGGAMAVDVWFSERLSQGAWAPGGAASAVGVGS